GNLRAEPVESSEVHLAWDASSDSGAGVEQYAVFRDGLEIGKSRAPAFVDRQVQLGGRYSYTVSAVDKIGRASEPSAPATASVQGRPPLRPSNPDPAHEAPDQPIHVTLTWQGGDPDRGDAVTYDLFLGTGPNPPARASGLASPSFAAMNLKPATTYFWKVTAKDRQGLTTEGDVWSFATSEEPNTPPSAVLSATPAAGPVRTVFRFDASASADKEDGPAALRFRWDFDGDGKPDGEPSEERVAERSFDALGARTVLVFVQDSKGAVSKASARIEVVNSPPVLKGDPLPMNGSTQEPPDATLSWRFEDPDPGDELSFDVYLGASEQSLRALARRQKEASLRPPEPLELGKVYYWRVDAFDSHGGEAKGPLWSFATRKVAGKVPLFAEIAVNARKGKTTTPFRFDASGSRDPDDAPDALRVRWDWNSDGTFDTDWTAERQAARTFPSVGEAKVTVEVRNSKGETAAASVAVQVENTPPVFVGVPSPRNGASKLEPAVRLAWEANDPDPEDALRYAVSLGPAGDEIPVAAKDLEKPAFSPPAPLKPGTYNWKVAVTDRFGGAAETPFYTFSVREEENLPPSRPRAVELPRRPAAGREETLTAESADPEGGPVRIRFDWGDKTMSGWIETGPGGKAEAKHVWAKPGSFKVKAQAADAKDKLSEWSEARDVLVAPAKLPGEGGDDLWYWDPEEMNDFPNLYTLKLSYWFANLGGGGQWEALHDPMADLDFRSELGISQRGGAPWFLMQFGRTISSTIEYAHLDYYGSTTAGRDLLFGGAVIPAGTDFDSSSRVRIGTVFASFNPYMGTYLGGGADIGATYFFNRTKVQPSGGKSVTESFEMYLPFLGIHLYGTATKFFR
ncbi:MAG: PKD domain-containing protein, partial [Planctomycetes bacterium]|nr:PKD domain-containing protein [Planctomycetota bacterium]